MCKKNPKVVDIEIETFRSKQYFKIDDLIKVLQEKNEEYKKDGYDHIFVKPNFNYHITHEGKECEYGFSIIGKRALSDAEMENYDVFQVLELKKAKKYKELMEYFSNTEAQKLKELMRLSMLEK